MSVMRCRRSSKNSKNAAPPPPPPEETKEEDHVSGPPVKQTLFGKMKSVSISARESLKELRNSYMPGRDVGDVELPAEDEAERPKTGSKTRTATDEDGPVWEPGTEQLRWTDPTYKVEKFVQPGIHPNHNKNFVKPDTWWTRYVFSLFKVQSFCVSKHVPQLTLYMSAAAPRMRFECSKASGEA